jgi:hypothetical protein
MSDETKPPTGRGYTVARSKFTIDDIKDLKRLFAEDPLAIWVRLAGLGAALGGLRIIWLALRYILKF